eukprot:scaffold230775_cov22-Tisochrysis_lutea.AAC.2
MDGFFRWLATAYDLPQRQAIVGWVRKVEHSSKKALKRAKEFPERLCSALHKKYAILFSQP